MSSWGVMWYVKRYSDAEIVLRGWGEDEYTYCLEDRRMEPFIAAE